MSRLTLDALLVLDAIDRKGSFAAAAAALYRVPSAVTYAVQKLEQDLGVTLFHREGRRSVLTPAGRVLLEQGRELLEAADRLVETTRQVDSGWESSLNIAVDSILEFEVVYPLMERFYQIKPDIEINLYEEVLAGAWEVVLDDRADLIVGAPEPVPSSPLLTAAAIEPVQWGFVVPAGHPLALLKRPLTETDIEQYRAVVVRDSSREMPSLTRRVLDRQPRLSVPTLQQKIDVQKAGLGVGFLPLQRITAELQRGELVRLSVVDESPESPLYVAWKTSNKGRALQWFVEQLVDG